MWLPNMQNKLVDFVHKIIPSNHPTTAAISKLKLQLIKTFILKREDSTTFLLGTSNPALVPVSGSHGLTVTFPLDRGGERERL